MITVPLCAAETSARMLALLSLLQSRPDWPGPELAERLGVSDRTIRNDIDRLRDLGYPVDAVRGAAGHYRLGVGAKLPPLLLDDEEAVAVAVGLRAGHGVAGIEEASGRALAKLEQVLPHRLRRRVGALHEATSQGPENTGTQRRRPAGRRGRAGDARRGRPRPRAGAASTTRPTASGRSSSSRTAWSAGSGGGTWSARVDGSVARAAGRLGDPADADAPARSPRTRCRGRTTRRSCCARWPRRAGRCTRGSRCSRPRRRCWPGSTRRSASSSRSTTPRGCW